jgi:hypothetical protein
MQLTTKLTTIASKVEKEASHKVDITTSFSAFTPHVKDDSILLTTKNKERKLSFTKEGLESYFKAIHVPKNFFSTCSPDLRQRLIREFHRKQTEKSITLRLYEDQIRYVASDRYQKFDDKDIISSLKSFNENLTIGNYFQDLHFFKLLIASEDPIELCNGKVFYPGVQILNSEAGLSSVRIDYFLHEEVCVNGAILFYKEYPSFKMRHVGGSSSIDFALNVSNAISNLPEIKRLNKDCLSKALKKKADEALKIIKGLRPKISLEKIEFLASGHQSGDFLSALDIILGYIEVMRSMPIDMQVHHEELAGLVLQRITSS